MKEEDHFTGRTDLSTMFASRISFLSFFNKSVGLSRTLCKTFRVASGIPCKPSRYQYSTSPEDAEKSLLKAVTDDKSLSVHWQDGHARFHHVWLRHHCPCPACLDPSTKQRTIDMALIPEQVRPQQVDVASADQLHIVWEDGHVTCFDASWLKENAYDAFSKGKLKRGFGTIANESEMILWNKEILAANPSPEFNYHDVMNDDGNWCWNPWIVSSAMALYLSTKHPPTRNLWQKSASE